MSRKLGSSQSFHDAILRKALDKAVRRLNPHLSDGAVHKVMAKVSDEVFAGDLLAENRRLHALMTGGVPITYFSEGEERSDRARRLDQRAVEGSRWKEAGTG